MSKREQKQSIEKEGEEHRLHAPPKASISLPEGHATVTKDHHIIGLEPPVIQAPRFSVHRQSQQQQNQPPPPHHPKSESLPKTIGLLSTLVKIKNRSVKKETHPSFLPRPSSEIKTKAATTTLDQNVAAAAATAAAAFNPGTIKEEKEPTRIVKVPAVLDGLFPFNLVLSPPPPPPRPAASATAEEQEIQKQDEEGQEVGEAEADKDQNGRDDDDVGQGDDDTEKLKSEKNHHAHATISAMTGYVNVPDFADSIVDDPHEIHSWVQDMTRKLYLFWVLIIILASFINAALVFCFRLMHEVYAVDFFRRIFLYGTFNEFGAVGAMLSIMAIATWGCFSLTTPFMTKVARKFKWIIFFILETYILFCIIGQVYECRDLKRHMEDAMIKDLTLGNKPRTRPTRLESFSQHYFECCGIHNYDDWRKMGHLNRSRRPDLRGGYPLSCCKQGMTNCSMPVTKYSGDSDVNQLWDQSCLNAEYLLTVLVISFVLVMESFCFLASIIAALLLRTVLNHTVTNNVEHQHPFT